MVQKYNAVMRILQSELLPHQKGSNPFAKALFIGITPQL